MRQGLAFYAILAYSGFAMLTLMIFSTHFESSSDVKTKMLKYAASESPLAFKEPSGEVFCFSDDQILCCQSIPGVELSYPSQRSPSNTCLDGTFSWGACPRGRFLCQCSEENSRLIKTIQVKEISSCKEIREKFWAAADVHPPELYRTTKYSLNKYTPRQAMQMLESLNRSQHGSAVKKGADSINDEMVWWMEAFSNVESDRFNCTLHWLFSVLSDCEESSSAKRFISDLVITVPTVERSGQGYLHSTLSKIADELQINRDGKICDEGSVAVLVMDNSFHSGNKNFSSAGATVQGFHSDRFLLVPNNKEWSSDASNLLGTVTYQTLNIISLLSEVYGRSKFILLMEDDFSLCVGAIKLITCILERTTAAHPEWQAIRVSHGMNGILLQNQDIVSLIIYLTLNMWHKPSDHNIVEWFLGERPDGTSTGSNSNRRPHFTYRFNLMSHIGFTSSFPWKVHRGKIKQTPMCYETMDARMGFRNNEAFVMDQQCGDSELWPCWGNASDKNSSFRISEMCVSKNSPVYIASTARF